MQLYNSTEKVILTGLLGTLESFVHSREISGNLFDIHCNLFSFIFQTILSNDIKYVWEDK